MKPGAKTALTAAAALVSTAGAGYVGALVSLSCLLLKKNSKLHKRLKVKRPKPLRKQEEEDFLTSYGGRILSVRSFDGLKLYGHLLEAKKPERIILMCHGWRGRWEGDTASAGAAHFLKKGSTLLLPEMRGQGKSQGHISMGQFEREDIHTWLDCLEKYNKDQLPVYLFGTSMGAFTVLMAAGDALPDSVRGIIADCGYNDACSMEQRFGRKVLHLRTNIMRHGVNTMSRLLFHVDVPACNSSLAMRRCAKPVLFIHGAADDFVPAEMTLQNYRECAAKDKRMVIIDGAGHIGSYLRDPERYCGEVERFFRETAGPVTVRSLNG